MTNDIAVSVDNLSVKFNDFTAVNAINFSVRRGEIFGFLGANGAGKTTTIRVLCGLLHPTSGTVKIGDVEFKNGTSEMEIKKKVGYMSQKFTLYNDLTVEENLAFIAKLRNIKSQVYLERQEFILNFISFQRPLNSFVHELPGGIKQQVSLAAAILHDPEIVFLDEPTAGVTPAARARFWALIRDLAKLGKTVFVTTHYMDEAEHCERIALMKTGEIVALDTPINLKKTIFPGKLYEFIPKEKSDYLKIASFSHHPGFDFFEPFGLKFHASFKNSPEGQNLKQQLSVQFSTREIIPTLEDVFIKVIEGKG